MADRKRAQPAGGLITGVEPDSLGDMAGLQAGDRLVSINGHSLRDTIDVQFYGADDRLRFGVDRDGKIRYTTVDRDYGDELGLRFANPTFDIDIRRCANNCDFCFVRQNARGMRRSLYIKDDDYRYSFLYGNFVTLTNLTKEDWERLDEQRLSPLYVSVHATELELRRRFLSRSSAPDVLEQLRRLHGLGIEVHAQVVLVPGLNDGEHLARTVADLLALDQQPVASVGIVPIGLTKHHPGKCRTYTVDESRAVLDRVEGWRAEVRRKKGRSFLYPSDEWYLVAGRAIPEADVYDGFPQVENGVGMVRQLLDEWPRMRKDEDGSLAGAKLKPATLVCGALIGPVLARIVGELAELTKSELSLLPVVNDFFGPVTTVSGLLTAQDVLAALEGRALGDAVVLPRAMFTGRYGAGSAPPGVTLDDVPVEGIARRLGVEVHTAATLADVVEQLQT